MPRQAHSIQESATYYPYKRDFLMYPGNDLGSGMKDNPLTPHFI
jgi:hypothetical protein